MLKSNIISTDSTIELIKNIVENNRCETCDVIEGERVRHQCGHGCCRDCVAKLEQCLLCLTPPTECNLSPLSDNPASRRAANAAKLFNTFQRTFNIDVYKRNRISKQLEIERELFPDCIQAPIKYHNKRKSSIRQSNKENSWQSFFPGEKVSPVKAVKMENSLNYVQNWLDNNDQGTPKITKRRAFAELNVNSPISLKTRIPEKSDWIPKYNEKSSAITAKKRKTSSFKPSLTLVKNQTLLDKHFQPEVKVTDFVNRKKDLKASIQAKVVTPLKKHDKDESGIVIDDLDDDPIIVDDSQSQVIDKDELAWRAVLDANEKSPYVSQSNFDFNHTAKSKNDAALSLNTAINKKSVPSNKVPFFKRSYLIETCHHCSKSNNDAIMMDNQVAGQPKDISITIENSSFLTTIKVSTVQDKCVYEKLSTAIQTDICNLKNPNNVYCSPVSEKVIGNEFPKPENIPSMNPSKDLSSQIFSTTDMKAIENLKRQQKSVQPAHLIIEDSDSDDPAIESSIIHVTADVHANSDFLEPDILAELEPSEVQQSVRRSKRGHTPNSSNSSEKENFDPNRIKKIKVEKKKSKKRKILKK